jgi:hypothetical protein
MTTRVIVLGTDHSPQLAVRAYEPAALLEAARCGHEAEAIRRELATHLPPRQAVQLDAYWRMHIPA